MGTDASERLWAPRGVSDPRRRGVTILGEGGDDNIIGTEYDDVLVGGDGTDQVCGRGGRDEIEASCALPSGPAAVRAWWCHGSRPFTG